MLNILITGANGQLGTALRHLGPTSRHNYIYTDLAELDITDPDAIDRFADTHAVDIIVNCAAYTNVERAEDDPSTARLINADAPRHLAHTARRRNATLIHISTDYVFPGTSTTPYTEDMPTQPLSVYGRTKLAGEQAIIDTGCRHIIIRTAWLYSEHGNNFLKTMMRLTATSPTLTVVADQIGTPTYAADLARSIFDIIEHGTYAGRDGIYHYTNEGVCSWYDFAVEIAAAARHTTCHIHPCHTCDYPTKARRPAMSVLDKTKYKDTFSALIPHWRVSMKKCIANIIKHNTL